MASCLSIARRAWSSRRVRSAAVWLEPVQPCQPVQAWTLLGSLSCVGRATGCVSQAMCPGMTRAAEHAAAAVSPALPLAPEASSAGVHAHACAALPSSGAMGSAGYSTEVKLFGRWSFEDVEVKDISLEDYIACKPKYAQFLPHSQGRWQKKRFRKAQCPIVERMVCSMMRYGRNNGAAREH